jgi:CMD domain protein
MEVRSMTARTPDVIDLLAGIEPGSPLDAVRAKRAQARENAQKSYLALFRPETPGNVAAEERYAVATFVAGLHRQPAVTDFYASGLRALGKARLAEAVDKEISRGAAEGPYGRYPAGPLSREDRDGPVYAVGDETRTILGRRLAAAFEHAHLLVFRPRDATAGALQRLLDAGWSTTDIVTLSQLVSFLAFQIRAVAGFRTLAAAPRAEAGAKPETVFAGALASNHI